jgi:alkylation response protein AidB-like acyl-CoA dehydrogenase
MTDEMISPEEFRLEARAWIEANLEPRRAVNRRAARTEILSPEQLVEGRTAQRTLFDAGYAGISYPTEYGGRGLTARHERVFREESVGYATPNLGPLAHITYGAIGRSMLAHATPEFLRRHIPPILTGEALWCQFYSEPDAGSDLAGIRTSAKQDGDAWVINGSKVWSTGAYYADWAMCLARTDWDVPKHRGLTWFAIPTNADGVTIRQIVQIDGTAGFCEEFLDNVAVTGADLIGEVNHGWSVAQTMLVYERGAGEMGASSREPRTLAPDLVALAAEVGRTHDPVARQAIARGHINDFAQYHLGKRIGARLRGAGAPDPGIAAYGKLASGELAPIRARLAMEIGGAQALLWDRDDATAGSRFAINYLNGRMTSIAAGTNEVQRNGIGERVLGLPREPAFDTATPFSEVLRNARTWNSKIG